MLGYLWPLMRPLLLFGVLYFVFTEFVRFGDGVENYPVYLLASIVLFTFFSETTSRGVTSLVERETLLRKIRFPRLVIPLSVALHALFNLGLNLIAVFVFVFAAGIDPRWSWLEMSRCSCCSWCSPPASAMLLSALYVRFRDVQPIWEVVAADPLLRLSDPLRRGELPRTASSSEAMANPITSILTQMRHALIDADAPTRGRGDRRRASGC